MSSERLLFIVMLSLLLLINYGPFSIAHEISRRLFMFRRDGYLETIGPAGMNAMNTL